MYLSVAFKILVFVLSVNAVSVNKRDTVSIPAQTCIDSLVNVNQALTILNSSASVVKGIEGYFPMFALITLFGKVDTNITAASTSCCAIASTLTDSDATAVLSEESTVANSIISLTNTFINISKPQIDQVVFMPSLTDKCFSNLINDIAPLLNCLTAMMPSDSMNTAQEYSTSILNSLQQDIAVFNTTNLPTSATAITAATTAIISPTA